MVISISKIFKTITLTMVAVAVIGLGQGVAKADEVSIGGFTNGCFGSPPINCTPPTSSGSQTVTFIGLTYVNSTFSVTTASGLASLTLGNFSLNASPASYDDNSFTLRVTFTAPQGIAGGDSTLFTASLSGTVTSNGLGGVLLNFNNTPILFTFIDVNCEPAPPGGGIPGQLTTCGSGSFLFSVNDLPLRPGDVSFPLTGQITGASQSVVSGLPEPASMLLLGTGLAGLAAAVRRRLARKSH